MIEALIFDLDGLLSDTEKLHYGSYREVFAGLGLEITEEVYKDHWIRDGKGIGDYVTRYQPGLDLAYIRERKETVYLRMVKEEGSPMPGALDCLDRLKPHFRMALASSSYAYSVNAVVEKLGIRDYFETFQTKESVVNLKPAPDIFLKAAESVDTDPGNCLVLEDAQKGIDAAHAAGMKSIAIPTEHTAENDFSNADLMCASLNEVTVKLICSLGKGESGLN